MGCLTMDNTREKLIELIQDGTHQCSKILCKECEHFAKLEKCKANIIADYLIANGVTVSDTNVVKWIPVSERLPDLIPCNAGTAYSEAVIVWTDNRKAMIAVWDGTDFWCAAEYWEAEGENITHWMPLPQPPHSDCLEK